MIRFALLMLLALPVWAGPATERYAPVQLQVARAALQAAALYRRSAALDLSALSLMQ